ncbi:MAG TPA: SRPBCC domain-containing protein [Candidatus Acidoferrales bacterium]|nr:SRPBCC domain-containing protein [Candidatus Acidoferrales bacterium]
MMTSESNLIIQGNSSGRRQMIVGAAVAFGSLAVGSIKSFARAAADEISHNAESIHIELVLKASRNRVYDALTDAKQFEKVVQLSAAVKTGMVTGGPPAQISGELGGGFSLFGGYVTGRQIELVPGQRIVQVWRAGSWAPGEYSLAKFVLIEQGSDTKVIFDHTGFPGDQAQHLLDGWHGNYFEPLAKFLA